MARKRVFGTIHTRTGRKGFSVKFTWQGRRYRRAAGPTWSTAEKKLAKAQTLLAEGADIEEVLSEVFHDERGGRLTFRDATTKYLDYAETRKKPSTLATDVVRFRVIDKASWAGNLLWNIKPEDLVRWTEERRKEGVTGSTVNRDLAVVSALFRWAIRMGYAEENPVRKVERFSEKGRERETYLTAEECRGLVDVSSPALRPLLVCALSTGMRRGELLTLRWRDVDFRRHEILVRPSVEKAGRGRTIPMTPDLEAELLRVRETRSIVKLDQSDPVFAQQDGKRLGVPGVRSMFASAIARCVDIPLEKKPRVTFHSLRHTAASLMVAASVPLFDVAKILGHSTLAVTMRYAHFAPEAGRAAIDRLGRALGFTDTVSNKVAEGGPAEGRKAP